MVKFSDIAIERPTHDALAERYAGITALLDSGSVDEALAEWDSARRTRETWLSMVRLRFDQDTADATAKAERDYADEIAPEATLHDVALKRRLLAHPDRVELEQQLGAQAFRLWESDIAAFEPAIKGDLEQESKLESSYVELVASARLEIGGETVNLSGLEPYAQSVDRDTRHRAEQHRWGFYAANGAAFDTIFDDMVKLRHGMARKLGYETYTPLGYRRMQRVDYGPEDVARYRQEVLTHVVPLVARVMAERPAMLGIDRLRYWDEVMDDPAGNPGPAGGHDFLVGAAQEMFDAMDPDLGNFYRIMREGGFLDLKNRPTKSVGGYCTAFPTVGLPFIYANFNGTDHDVQVFTHEMGHAFQNWRSRHQTLLEYHWPTMDGAEIDSMGLEFLTWPGIDRLVGADAADRFRRAHMLSSLAFLPYGVCVDHFQHEVYARPDATPAERHAMWQKLERLYLPWRDWGDLAYPAKGGMWQAKRHIYCSPFYYIDYTLAQCCAMQFWVKSRQDYKQALADYVKLCSRGGEAPFQTLVREAGLVSPFEPGALAGVVKEAASFLGL